jgi:hypothetical protein
MMMFTQESSKGAFTSLDGQLNLKDENGELSITGWDKESKMYRKVSIMLSALKAGT